MADAYSRQGGYSGQKDWPTYDAGGSGPSLQPLFDNPWKEATTGSLGAAQIAAAAMSAPGYWKALTVPAAAPLVGVLAHDAYRAGQQINGDHPTQLNQKFWQSIVDQKYEDEMQKNRLLQLGYGQR